MELEAQLARQPVVYLVLNLARGVVEVRSRSLTLDTVPIQGVKLVRRRRLLSVARSTPQVLPVIWIILEGPPDTDRVVIAPETLQPAPSDDEDFDELDRLPSPTPTPAPEIPRSYRARLDTGWDLWITNRVPSRTWWQRLLNAAGDGVAVLRGHSEPEPPAVVILMSRSDAHRLYHLIRSDTRILVTTQFR